jgi:hypothetical protein
MPMTDSQLVIDANIIRNETATGANTATRVGTMLDNIIVNKINNDKIDTNNTLAANSDLLVASQKATKTYVTNQVSTINGTITAGLALKENAINKSNGPLGSSSTLFPTESSVSTALTAKENITNKVTTEANFITDGASVTKYPAIKAVKDYVDGVATGLLRDNGNYDPTVTGDYPTSANTLSGGAVQVGDLWYIDTAGTMNGNAVLVGYSVRALINGAGATNDADWAIANVGLGFVPENSANKSTDGTFNSGSPSTTLFPTQSAVATYVSNSVGSTTLQQVLVNHDLIDQRNYQGTGAGTDAVGTRYNVNAFGSQAARFNSGDNINAFGSNAMTSSSLLTPNGDYINAFGYFAAYDTQGGDINAFGRFAANVNTGSYINAIGSYVCDDNSGNYVNGIGYNCLLNNSGSNVSAIGFEAGNNNTFSYVNLFGHSAQADANNQTVFTNGGSNQVRIDYNSVSTDRKYTLPDQSGTFAMLSDIPTSTGWGLTGNAGTNPSTNFIGTTDAQDLVLKANNSEFARLHEPSGEFRFLSDVVLSRSGTPYVEVNSTSGEGAAAIATGSVMKGNLVLRAGSYNTYLYANNSTANRNLVLPNESGILPLTVNGIAANTAGNITLPVGAPYKVCTLNINWDGANYTIENNYQDTIGVTISTATTSRFTLTSSGQFTLGKTVVMPMVLSGQNPGLTGFLDWTFAPTTNAITIRITNSATGALTAPTAKGTGVQWILEVRVYP